MFDRGPYKRWSFDRSETDPNSHEKWLRVEGQYDRDQKQGRWITYFSELKKACEGVYDHGERVGKWTSYAFDGKQPPAVVDFTTNPKATIPNCDH